MNLEDLTALFLDQHTKGKLEKTRAHYLRCLNRFTEYLDSKNATHLSAITPGLIESYSQTLAKEVRNNTRYVYLNMVHHFLNWLYEQDYLFLNLSEHIKQPKWERKLKKNPTDKDIQRFLNCYTAKKPEYETRDKLIGILHLAEKLMPTDLSRLSLLDIDFGAKELRVIQKKRFQALQDISIIYLKKYVRQRSQWGARTDWLLISAKGGIKMSLRQIRGLVSQIRKGVEQGKWR